MNLRALVLLSLLAFTLGYLLFPSKNPSSESNPTISTVVNYTPAPRTTEEENTISVYRQTNEAVVFISTVTMTVDPYDWFPQYKPQQGSGSGVIIDSEKGIILTNQHVISNASKIEIMLADGMSYQAKLLGVDQSSDLAVLKMIDPPTGIKKIDFGDSSHLEIGQRVLAIGNPFGLNRTLTTGIISSLDRTLKTNQNNYLRGLIQTDAAINPGNSGGPLLDSSGKLIGINTIILSQSGDSAGIGFAIPINRIKKILPELIKHGKVKRPDFGWVLTDSNQSPVIRRIFQGSAAEKADLQALERYVSNGFIQSYYLDYDQADLIFSINGQRIKSKLEVDEIIESLKQGDSLLLELRQGGIRGPARQVKILPDWR